MTDDSKKRKQDEERPLAPPDPAAESNPADDEETQTVSLLDLMAEEAGESGQDEGEKAPAAQSEGEEAPADDASEEDDAGGQAGEATPTGPPIPAKLPRPKPKTLPPLAKDRTIASRPLEQDEEATRVQPRVAFPGSTDPRAGKRSDAPQPPQDPPTEPHLRRPRGGETAGTRPVRDPAARRRRPQPVHVAMPRDEARPAPRASRSGASCVVRFLLIALLSALVLTAMGMAAAVVGYGTIASQLPPVSELRERASDFETAVIYDRQGTALYSFSDPEAGDRTPVRLDQISPYVISATIATEDARFYTNPGFDPVGISRAIVQAAQEQEIVSGASTITQQLARALLLDEDERAQRTFGRKVKEIILAAEMYRTYEKDEILELYLNEIYYGNLAYGIEAASQQYFNKRASDLTLAEASLLAGLPQAPAAWDPYTAPELALGRQAQVLRLMVVEGYITPQEAQAAIETSAPVVRSMRPPPRTIRHPHFVFTVLQQLEDTLGAQAIYAGGLRVHTTLDADAQRLAEETLAAHGDRIAGTGARNAALVAIDPADGAIVAMVGSLDFNSEAIRGQVNMALAPRQPGSAIKPLVYLSAMEEGWTPATLIWDVPTRFPDGANPLYEPKNYDDEFHGPMLLRPALGNSYNIPAVKALEYVGVCPFIEDLRRFEISLQDEGCAAGGVPNQHGLSLALGGGEISPLRMTAAFATLAGGGVYHQPYTIERITNAGGDALGEYAPPDPQGQQVMRRAHAFLLSHILSDNAARQPEFSPVNNLTVDGHRVAAKTGTSGTDRFDVRDGWTVGFAPQIAAGVWVGNTDQEPVNEGQSGYQMASPIWRDFMSGYLASRPALEFSTPEDVVQMEICAVSGARPGPDCPERTTEYFASDQLPPPAEDDFLQRVPIDLWTGLRANEHCQEGVFEATFVHLRVSGREDVVARDTDNARRWIEETVDGRAWAQSLDIELPLRLPPEESCTPETARPEAVITAPQANQEVTGQVEVRGSATAPNFAGYALEYGLSHNPGGWAAVGERRGQAVNDGLLGAWDTGEISQSGPVTLRLLVYGPDNPFTEGEDPVTVEARVLLSVQHPTPTPTPTPTETPTPTGTPTPTETPTSTPTPEATETFTPTPTPEETALPVITTTPVVITLPAPTRAEGP
ncbi:MAG TPA: transglycosylase domain-containing protein [Candidatus Sulfomarinibacteraceae bacterium]|nr:transglycosylase domain-containing protein [Candidatus Sulfomarinibacteraceae bacterium]